MIWCWCYCRVYLPFWDKLSKANKRRLPQPELESLAAALFILARHLGALYATLGTLCVLLSFKYAAWPHAASFVTDTGRYLFSSSLINFLKVPSGIPLSLAHSPPLTPSRLHPPPPTNPPIFCPLSTLVCFCCNPKAVPQGTARALAAFRSERASTT